MYYVGKRVTKIIHPGLTSVSKQIERDTKAVSDQVYKYYNDELNAIESRMTEEDKAMLYDENGIKKSLDGILNTINSIENEKLNVVRDNIIKDAVLDKRRT
jgi:uncharacterized membrane protein YheB (UPF0754 family)